MIETIELSTTAELCFASIDRHTIRSTSSESKRISSKKQKNEKKNIQKNRVGQNRSRIYSTINSRIL